jgi:hypothetical protein
MKILGVENLPTVAEALELPYRCDCKGYFHLALNACRNQLKDAH